MCYPRIPTTALTHRPFGFSHNEFPGPQEGCIDGSIDLNEPPRVCRGLGHTTCVGGAPGKTHDEMLNPFGKDFYAAGMTWTEELCRVDSDGDGQSNGVELGDPCCLWAKGDREGAFTANWHASHPGRADSTADGDVPEAYVCESDKDDADGPIAEWGLLPAQKAQRTAAFRDGEEQRTLDWIIQDYEMPERRTTYVNFVFNFDDEDCGGDTPAEECIFHIIYGEAIVDQPNHLHHFVVTGCSQKVPGADQGKPAQPPPSFCNMPVGGFAGWAPGRTLWDSPDSAGTPIGPGVGIVAVSVNVRRDSAEDFSRLDALTLCFSQP